jgi:predicted nucleic acid-binding protein
MNLFDASALVKRYVREVGSSTVRRLLAQDAAAVSVVENERLAGIFAERERAWASERESRDLES